MKHLFKEFYIFRHPRLAIPFTFITFAKDYKNNQTDNPMKKSILLLFAAFATLLMLSCNEAAKSNKDSLSNDTIENKDSNEAPKNKEENDG